MHDDTPGALDKLYSMLQDADSLGLSRPARMRLIGIIGSLENEELDKFRSSYLPPPGVTGDEASSSESTPRSRRM